MEAEGGREPVRSQWIQGVHKAGVAVVERQVPTGTCLGPDCMHPRRVGVAARQESMCDPAPHASMCLCTTCMPSDAGCRDTCMHEVQKKNKGVTRAEVHGLYACMHVCIHAHRMHIACMRPRAALLARSPHACRR